MAVNEKAFLQFPTIETSRLVLGPFEAPDATDVFELFGSEIWLKYVPREALTDPAQAVEKIQSMSKAFEQRSAIWWAFHEKTTGEFIGYGGLFEINRGDHNAEIGYGFKPESWGKGFASEAMGPIVDFGFENLGLRRIFGLIDPENIASIKVIERLGFEQEGVLRSAAFARGRYWDQCLYARVAREYSAIS